MKMPKLKQWDAVQIHWTDSHGLAADWHRPAAKEMTIEGCVTVGQVYKVHKDRVTVASSWDSVNKHIHGGITIPIANITSIRKLA